MFSLNNADLAHVAGLAGLSPAEAADAIGRGVMKALAANLKVEDVVILLYPGTEVSD